MDFQFDRKRWANCSKGSGTLIFLVYRIKDRNSWNVTVYFLRGTSKKYSLPFDFSSWPLFQLILKFVKFAWPFSIDLLNESLWKSKMRGTHEHPRERNVVSICRNNGYFIRYSFKAWEDVRWLGTKFALCCHGTLCHYSGEAWHIRRCRTLPKCGL